MAKYRFRGALNAADFPFVSSFQGRTVVQPQLDNNVRTTQAFYGTEESADYSIPQLLYCENVLPTAEGLQSVGYDQVVDALPGAMDFDQAITLRDADENNFLFCPAGGKNYIYRGNTGAWVSTNPIVAPNSVVSRAYVNGRTFICYSGVGIFEYDSTANTFLQVTVIGIAPTDIDGIGASNNYLILFSDITVFWSSLIDPLDFVPSILTGAGFSIPQDVKAKITTVVGTSGGFIVYTAKNAVAAVYTNNIRAPFAFKEVSNAGGILTYEQVTSDQSAGPQYAWTTGGLQKITPQGSESISAAVNDFLAGQRWEYWDSVNKQLVEQAGGGIEFNVKVTYIASRWLVVSYSIDTTDTYQYALVYDVILKRWGKLKFNHVDCFSYPYPNVYGDLTYGDLAGTSYEQLGDTTYEGMAFGLLSDPPSKGTIAFLGIDGTVTLLAMTYKKTVAEQGVAIFGKFQLVRARMMALQQLDIEGSYISTPSATPQTRVTILKSLDGKNLDSFVEPKLVKQRQNLQVYMKRVIGLNLGVAVEGTFALSSYLLEVTNEGDR